MELEWHVQLNPFAWFRKCTMIWLLGLLKDLGAGLESSPFYKKLERKSKADPDDRTCRRKYLGAVGTGPWRFPAMSLGTWHRSQSANGSVLKDPAKPHSLPTMWPWESDLNSVNFSLLFVTGKFNAYFKNGQQDNEMEWSVSFLKPSKVLLRHEPTSLAV